VARPTELPAIIRTATRLPAQLLSEGDALTNGVVYVAPPNRHVFFRLNRTLGLSSAPRLRFVRPSADWLFESAAAAFGRCCTAVVLSGRLSDGACGVVRVKRADGCVIAQTPSTCDYPSMPAAAIRARCVDLVLEPEAIGPALCRIVGESHSTPLANEWQAPFAALDC
jgi:two-component system chemotaxis response regulator CheB